MDIARHPRSAATAVAATLVALGACSDGGTGPDFQDVAFHTSATFPEIRDEAATRPVRIEVEVLPGGPPWQARELELETDDESDDDEKLESRIVAADEVAGTITLSFADKVVDLSSATRFRAEGSDGDGGTLSREAFLARVRAKLDAGQTPGVELRRPTPAAVQAPDDATFVPTDVRLDDEADFGEVEINVDGRHFDVTGDASGVLTVLGVEIRVDGARIERRNDEAAGAFEIEAMVASVDVAARRVLTMDGTIIQIVDGTRFDDDSGDEDELGSLPEVAAALEAGLPVEVEADVVVSGDVLVAVEIEFEVEDDEDDDFPGGEEIEAFVTAVDVGAGTFTVEGGAVVRITPETRIDPEGDFLTLQAVADALAAAVPVEADADVIRVDGALVALKVEFEDKR